MYIYIYIWNVYGVVEWVLVVVVATRILYMEKREGGEKSLYKKQEPNLYAKESGKKRGIFWIKVQDDMMIGG